MYTDIDCKTKRVIEDGGRLTLRVKPSWSCVGKFESVPFIVYYQPDKNPLNRIELFNFYLTETETSWVMMGLRFTKEGNDCDPPTRELLFRMLVDEALKKSGNSGLVRVEIYTKIPCAGEVLAEKLFGIDTFEYTDTPTVHGTFRAEKAAVRKKELDGHKNRKYNPKNKQRFLLGYPWAATQTLKG